MEFLTDDRDVHYVEDGRKVKLPRGWAMCLTCFRAWDDEHVTSVTPTPSARCPFEYNHMQGRQGVQVVIDMMVPGDLDDDGIRDYIYDALASTPEECDPDVMSIRHWG